MTTSRSAASTPSLARIVVDPAETNGYYPALDGIRAVAFLMVFAQHYLYIPWGWAGVDVFFVLSGFLITGILFDTRDLRDRLRNFYVRRTLRIFPLYYGVALLLLLSYPLFRWRWSWMWLLWPAYLGNFIRGQQPYAVGSAFQMLADAQPVSAIFPRVQLYFGHFWSLCVEEQFYLIWPWVVFWLRDRRKLLLVCLACVVACPLLRVLASHQLPSAMLDQEVLLRYTPFRVDALLLGGLIALVRRGPSARRLLMAARLGLAALAIALLVWLALGPSRFLPGGYVYPASRFTWGLSFIDLFAACVIVMALESGSVMYRLFAVRPLRWLGRISYGAYIFHDVLHHEMIQFVRSCAIHQWVLVTAALGLSSTVLLAWASFRWFETPFIRLKDLFTLTPVRHESEAQSGERRAPARTAAA